MEQKDTFFFHNWMALTALGFLVALAVWWLTLDPFVASDDPGIVHYRYVWGATYQILALWGAICGFFIARFWGSWKSVIGRSVIAFSVGLLLQVWGQSVYSYYNLFSQIQAPYPSLGDIGYFGSIFAYLYGAMLLARAAGVQVSLKSYKGQALAFLLPLLLLSASYFFFLRSYIFDWSQPVKVILDFGYPLLQSFYVSIAILTLFLSRKILGGLMRPAIVVLLVALVVQYLSDFNFLYEANKGAWYVGGYGDLMYAFSYFCMTTSLIYIGHIFKQIKNSQ